MSIIPVGRRSEMVGQIFRLANDQLHQPDAGSSYMASGISHAPAESVNASTPAQATATGVEADSANFHDFVYETLASLGIDPQIISRKSNSLIKFEEDISSGKMTGSFLIPIELPDGKSVSHDSAKQVAIKVFDKFNLKGKISRDQKRSFYIISFSTKEAEVEKPQNEGSLANLPDNDPENKTTTASVQAEMLLMRKSMLIDALKKGGYIK